MSEPEPDPSPTSAKGVSEREASSQTPFHCAMPEAIPPRERCGVQCAHCRHHQRRQARVLPSDDGWALVAPDGEVLSTHQDRELATAAFERYLLSDGPPN